MCVELRVHSRERIVSPHVPTSQQIACIQHERSQETRKILLSDAGGVPQSQFKGESGSGWASRAMMDRHTDCSVYTADQAVFNWIVTKGNGKITAVLC